MNKKTFMDRYTVYDDPTRHQVILLYKSKFPLMEGLWDKLKDLSVNPISFEKNFNQPYEQDKKLLSNFSLVFSSFILFCLIKPSYYQYNVQAAIYKNKINTDNYPNIASDLIFFLIRVKERFLCLFLQKDPNRTADSRIRLFVRFYIPLSSFPFPQIFMRQIEGQVDNLLNFSLFAKKS